MRAKEFIAFVEKGETYDIKREPLSRVYTILGDHISKDLYTGLYPAQKLFAGLLIQADEIQEEIFRRTFRIDQGTTCSSDRPCLAGGPFG